MGMTCDGMDVIAKNILVPIDAQVGDWLGLGGMGSYTYGCRSKFNGMSSTDKVIRWPITFKPQKTTTPSILLA